ncbi:uncharacterized protein E0L32_011703 [Thyridium curvatum]|uniref:DUF4604 domain-containing protein n=1 Tax=Thyridium curvatum TaxID=1093900 RepID=A0A507BGD2_9PEZI|nr:uncharacterized protein E0L32_011682 [Thyridium curvatum]XP_031000127.1 uncharacterized protein E0L32_011703 [Thyridium curvatum]TPX18395.1 hypothetical protein E0L32_011682 [Thyridium curvatum]TPX18416.1 hypothetical protein E0L32_011703 [Thyridium curvatum]
MSSSQKITSKNLSYSQNLPPFLAALRGQHAPSDADGPDPILAARSRRPAARRRGSASEDAPLVLDEEGNVVSDVAVGVDGSVSRKEGPQDGGATAGAAAAEEDGKTHAQREGERVAGIGAGKKRKVGRVVGGDDAQEEEEEGKGERNEPESKHAGQGKAGQGKRPEKHGGSGRETKGDKTPKSKKKAKKIKLSFGDADGD